MTSLTKVIGAAALAAMVFVPQAMARDGRSGGGFGGPSGGARVGSAGQPSFSPGANARAFNRGTFSGGNFANRGPRNFNGNWNGGRKYSNWNGGGNWNGPRHHHRHNRGFRFYTYGAPYYYDDYYDYGYASYDDDYSGACSVYYRRWQATGSPRWRNRYYDCIS